MAEIRLSEEGWENLIVMETAGTTQKKKIQFLN